jgi:hydrogenase nickel incorporation protein HypA/HybF
MHELGIANSIVREVRAQARHRDGHVAKVGVRVGEVSGVDPAALAFCFDALVRDTELYPLELEIERAHHRHRCPRCEKEFRVVDLDSRCVCGETKTQFVGGDELEVIYLEVEA